MPQPRSFVDQIATAWHPAAWQDVSVLVAVSGGADSLALLRGLAELKTAGAGRLVVAHFNHQFRGADSEADEAFVAELCQSLGLGLRVGRATDWPIERGDSADVAEAAARATRYEFLRHTAELEGARFVALAHTADDQVETILHRIVRGTGLAGLGGIRRSRALGPAATIVRPLLGLWRADVIAYLAGSGQPYREDLSNGETRYTRNRIRHELLPMLRDYNPQVSEAVVRLGQLAGEAQSVVDELVESLAERAGLGSTTDRQPTAHSAPAAPGARPATLELNGKSLAEVSRYLVRELLVRQWRAQGWSERDMGWAEWDWLASVLVDRQATGVRILPGSVRAQYDHGRLVLSGSAE